MARKDGKDRGLYRYPDGEWGVEYYTPEGKRRRQKVGSKSDARAYYEEITRRKRVGDVLPERRARLTVAGLLDLYLQERCRNRDSQADALRWKEWVGEHLPEQVTTGSLRTWVAGCRERGLAVASILRRLAPLSAAYSLGVERGLIPAASHPLRNKAALGLDRINNERERFLAPDEELRLLEVLGETWWPYVHWAILTGMRWSNQVGLRWEHVHDGYVMLPDTKSKKRQPVLLSEESKRILETMKARRPNCPWVFPSPEGYQLHHSNFRNRHWMPALRRAGVSNFRWHDLRHTCASRLVQAGYSLEVVQAVLGHKDPRVSKRYSHLGNEVVRQAMETLSVFLQQRENGDLSPASSHEIP